MKASFNSAFRRAPGRFLAFTLLELLVVLAIISVLAALLVPAAGNAKSKVNDIKCGQNERQIQMAILIYANDHNNTYMDPLLFNEQWRQMIHLSNIITVYKFYRCPSSHNDTSPSAATWSWWSTTINGVTQWTEYKINDSAGLVGKPLDGVHRPQTMVLVIDGQDWSPRHQGKENLCFFDGHVELVTYDAYNGVEPGREAIGSPVAWFNWGIND